MPSAKVLLVDDDPDLLEIYREYLRDQFLVQTAARGEQALDALARFGPFAVIVADMQMAGGMNGIDFLNHTQAAHPDTVRIMLTGDADQRTAVEAINRGQVFQFLTKPCPPSVLSLALEAGVKQFRLVTAERELLEKTVSGSLKMLAELLAMVAPHSFSLSVKLRDEIRQVAHALQVDQSWEWESAAMLCQVGAVTIPAAVMQKAVARQTLLPQEREMIARIPEVGFNLLANIPRLEGVARIVLYQNKCFNGAGFPSDGCAGENLPQASRALKILLDKAELDRQPLSAPERASLLRTRSGAYDPDLLELILRCLAPESAAPSAPRALDVSWKMLKPGDLLLSDIETKEGWLIVAAGNKITPTLLVRLQNFAELSGIKEPIRIEPGLGPSPRT